MSNYLNNNSEILFLYDAKRCNPNGDMDNENKPRMDWEAGRNLVSDVRLKRYVRDYILYTKKQPIFVRKLGEDALKAKEALNLFKLVHLDDEVESELTKEDLKLTKSQLNKLADDVGDRVFDLADIRLFGATIPIEIEDGRGASSTFTGPVQFNWGYSLNRIDELQESKTITSHLQTGKSEAGAGIGKDYRVNYSFLAFSGGVNARVAQTTHMTPEDLSLLDEALVKAIPLNRTRSKIGQTPRLYLRIELQDDKTALNDLREYISLETAVPESELREIDECTLDASELNKYLTSHKDDIESVYWWKNDRLRLKGLDLDSKLFEPLTV